MAWHYSNEKPAYRGEADGETEGATGITVTVSILSHRQRCTLA